MGSRIVARPSTRPASELPKPVRAEDGPHGRVPGERLGGTWKHPGGGTWWVPGRRGGVVGPVVGQRWAGRTVTVVVAVPGAKEASPE